MRSLSRFIYLSSEIWKNISLSKKRLFYIYILLSVVITIIDFLSITSLMNIVSYATNSEIVSKEKLNILVNISVYSEKSLFTAFAKSAPSINEDRLSSISKTVSNQAQILQEMFEFHCREFKSLGKLYCNSIDYNKLIGEVNIVLVK